MTPELRTAEPELLEHELPGAPPEVTQGRRAPEPRRRRSSPRAWLVVLVVAVVWSLVRSGVGQGEVVNAGGWGMIRRFLAAAVQPELSAEFLGLTGNAALTTLSYAVVGTALSIAIGLVFGVLASETWWRRVSSPRRRRRRRSPGGWVAARGVLSLPRGVHEAVWGLFLARVLGLDPLVGVLAIAIPYGAVTAKVYAELLDEAPGGPFRAVQAAGAGRLKALFYTAAPAVAADVVSYAFYRLECSIRAAAILGIIGAGGLGFQLALSFQSLRYDEMWTLLYALVLLSGITDVWSAALRRRARHAGTASSDGRLRRDPFLAASAVALAGLVVAGWWHLGLAPDRLVAARARSLFGDLARSAWPPDFDTGALATLARATLETVEMSVVATAMAGTGGAVVALALGRPSRRLGASVATVALRTLLLLCRAIPPPVWALLFLFVLFPGPLPGALALAAYNFGILGRLMAEVVENGDDRPAAALRAQGAGPAAVVFYGVAPAVMPRFVSYVVYRWEVTLRETVVVGLVGAGGLGRLLTAQLTAFDHPGVLATLVALVALTFLADVVGASIRRSLR